MDDVGVPGRSSDEGGGEWHSGNDDGTDIVGDKGVVCEV